MIANYHTHTPLCHHAQGTAEEYARAALDQGMKILGFSDHTPYWFPEDYCSDMRMLPQQLKDYVQEVLSVRRAFRDRLEIPLGLEVEYYPRFWQKTLARLQDAGIEYFLLGQHWFGNELDGTSCGRPTEQEEDLARYCDQVIEAMNTGVFTYLAHPDLIFFTGSDRVYRAHMGRLCREARSCSLPLEINLQGFLRRRHFPTSQFWEIAAEENCSVVLGVDAHAPNSLTIAENEARALEIVNRFGLNLLETVELRSIR